jgi:hypothetical protein
MRLLLGVLSVLATACSVDVKNKGGDPDAGPPAWARPGATEADAAPHDTPSHDSGSSPTSSGSGSAADSGTHPSTGVGGSTETGITTNPVPYDQIFCDAPDVTGQTIVVPCVTAIELSSDWGKPTPGGSHCNGGYFYTVSVVTNTFTWLKCLEGANPDDPWEPDSGTHELTDDQTAALVDSLKVMTLSSATDCAGMDDVPLKTAYITTRTALSKYTDSHYGCYLQEIFVDHIDDALAIVDAMAK